MNKLKKERKKRLSSAGKHLSHFHQIRFKKQFRHVSSSCLTLFNPKPHRYVLESFKRLKFNLINEFFLQIWTLMNTNISLKNGKENSFYTHVLVNSVYNYKILTSFYFLFVYKTLLTELRVCLRTTQEVTLEDLIKWLINSTQLKMEFKLR